MTRTMKHFGLIGCVSVLVGCSSFARPVNTQPLAPADLVQRAANDDIRTGEPGREPAAVGFLQHRQQQHDLRDLLDPVYRAASTDPFVQGFEPELMYAGVWAAD